MLNFDVSSSLQAVETYLSSQSDYKLFKVSYGKNERFECVKKTDPSAFGPSLTQDQIINAFLKNFNHLDSQQKARISQLFPGKFEQLQRSSPQSSSTEVLERKLANEIFQQAETISRWVANDASVMKVIDAYSKKGVNVHLMHSMLVIALSDNDDDLSIVYYSNSDPNGRQVALFKNLLSYNYPKLPLDTTTRKVLYENLSLIGECVQFLYEKLRDPLFPPEMVADYLHTRFQIMESNL